MTVNIVIFVPSSKSEFSELENRKINSSDGDPSANEHLCSVKDNRLRISFIMVRRLKSILASFSSPV